MKKLLILLIITINLTAQQSCCKDYDVSVDSYVLEVLMQSSVKSRLKDAHYFIDGDDNSKSIQAFLEHDNRTMTIGWFEFNMKKLKLYEISMANPDEPIEISYEDAWRDVMAIVSSGEPRECIKVKKKSWLYTKADVKNKSKKFLIKNDVALILKRKKGWYKIYFYHPKWNSSTILWIKEEDV